ncbi:MAG: acetoacetate metabolism regulatory protein AtoC [Nitrospirales bacterium]|nr:MAG: acetoacetate metabolism regulatory protein AtoC [Nitrospirales bacterium]
MTHGSVLIIDDEPLMRVSMVDALKAIGYVVQEASSGLEGLERLQTSRFNLVITDLRLPGVDGLHIVKHCREQCPGTEVIVITAHGSVDTAVNAMKSGAYDYITKPFSMDELLLSVQRVCAVVALREENRVLRDALEKKFSFQGIVGKNERMRQVLEKVKLVSATDATVLVVGESGTGKELIANAIHSNSARRNHSLVKVSCAALPETLLEAELFGHEKGAFTGALRQRQGRFELAHQGTLFLDEIGEISPLVQIKLLRVLQERQFERVGGNDTIEVDVRLVCATQKDLRKEVEHGRFREDLYYRLNVVPVQLPPLRERREDIFMIANHFLETMAGRIHQEPKSLSRQAREVLLQYSFPGNVRELENTIERGLALAQHTQEIQVWDLCGQSRCPFAGGEPQKGCGFCGNQEGRRGVNIGAMETLAEAREHFERGHILEILNRTGWSRMTASKVLGLSRKGLWEKCKRYGIVRACDDTDSENGDDG